jgi:hypothetical protein
VRLVNLDPGDLVMDVARVVSEDDKGDDVGGEEEPAGVAPEDDEEE